MPEGSATPWSASLHHRRCTSTRPRCARTEKNHWIHVYSAGPLTVKRLHPKRGCEAIEATDIIPRYGGVAVHDCWASYLSYTHCDHGLCSAHLLRELTFIVDARDYAWAQRMKRLLLDACHEVAQRDEKTLSAASLVMPSMHRCRRRRGPPSPEP